MKELLNIYWSNYMRLLLNPEVPNHTVESAYIVHNKLLIKLSKLHFETYLVK